MGVGVESVKDWSESKVTTTKKEIFLLAKGANTLLYLHNSIYRTRAKSGKQTL